MDVMEQQADDIRLLLRDVVVRESHASNDVSGLLLPTRVGITRSSQSFCALHYSDLSETGHRIGSVAGVEAVQ
ncbi:hypothetical protein TPA0910_47320 [Streptomyces hygroscopicus subsp. sporocinereus]|uniref:Uncharacterized protein n=1 Tax=Streptomyces hygroscopicus TaxID=1912 RepID=A0ABQ3U3V7_STRHY|nr:hypothetical protein TPA0910_47320 [Streptomyces hygroscopicus]